MAVSGAEVGEAYASVDHSLIARIQPRMIATHYDCLTRPESANVVRFFMIVVGYALGRSLTFL